MAYATACPQLAKADAASPGHRRKLAPGPAITLRVLHAPHNHTTTPLFRRGAAYLAGYRRGGLMVGGRPGSGNLEGYRV